MGFEFGVLLVEWLRSLFDVLGFLSKTNQNEDERAIYELQEFKHSGGRGGKLLVEVQESLSLEILWSTS